MLTHVRGEELVVRKELSDNFCHFEPDGYDSLDGAAAWARESLELHSSDPREFTYSREQLEGARTHDDLWNASQKQHVHLGKIAMLTGQAVQFAPAKGKASLTPEQQKYWTREYYPKWRPVV